MTMNPRSLTVLCLLAGCGGAASEQCHATMASGDHAAHHGMAGEHAHGHGTMDHVQHDFSDVARFEAMFDAPDRVAWQHPVSVVAMLEATPGQTVVDLGTGTGYFLPFLSVAVGTHGHVLALDTEAAMIAHVTERMTREGITNVEARTVGASDPGLAPESVDHVLVVDTWHHLTGRNAYAEALRTALRPGGSVVVVDFTAEASHGPPVADRVSPESVALELTNAGFRSEVLAEDLPEQYVVRGRR
jgi:predicted methyltransferase